MIDYSYPIPKKCLITRFSGIFSRLSNHQNATVVALPYTGRTSHLRFISTHPDTQKLLGLKSSDRLIWLEMDRTDYSYSQFLKELSFALDPNIQPSEDDYLSSVLIHQKISQLSKIQHLILIITLNWKTLPALSDIDRFLTILQKSASLKNLNYLFSIDTEVFRSVHQLHPSSLIFEKIFYFPTFTKSETIHSIKRLYLSKNLPQIPELLSKSFHLSGGIAGFFHSLINLGPDFLNHPSLEPQLSKLKSELTKSKDLIYTLTTPTSQTLINKTNITNIILGNLILANSPTAQEINLLKLFQEKINSPITRDEIAACLWGINSPKKYSDWAIDKAISRLRKLLISKDYHLITVKNLGYQLTNFI